jgi:hypothetical protein|tara:strand:- start:498 stop:698 length:201 start_codon:yes stop_codon:yes gene_type:complete
VRLQKGDLVACYLINSDLEAEALMQYGIVVDVNQTLKDVLVLDNYGDFRWWTENRWRILKKAKENA